MDDKPCEHRWYAKEAEGWSAPLIIRCGYCYQDREPTDLEREIYDLGVEVTETKVKKALGQTERNPDIIGGDWA